MKRAWPILVLLTTLLWADGVYQFDFTGTGTGSAINNVRAQNAYQKISWTITGGTLSGCQVQLDSSTDGSSWSAGGAITSQACTSNGASAIVNTTPNYMRINVTTFTVATGTPILHVIWRGYVNNPVGGGTPGGSNAQIQYNNSGAFGGAANTSLDSSGNAVFNTVGTGTAPTACGSATGCFAATGASTTSTQTASQGSCRLDSTTGYWLCRNVNGTNEVKSNTAKTTVSSGAIGAIDATNGPAQIYICTATCSLTPLSPPAADYQLCVVMAAGVTGTITLNALGNSAMYGKTDGSAYGTAGTGTAVSTSTTGNRICIVGRDATHYETTGSNGTWTMN